jgi:hypothetical protein
MMFRRFGAVRKASVVTAKKRQQTMKNSAIDMTPPLATILSRMVASRRRGGWLE